MGKVPRIGKGSSQTPSRVCGQTGQTGPTRLTHFSPTQFQAKRLTVLFAPIPSSPYLFSTVADFILALDQGTTSSRAILFNRSGQIHGVAQKEFQQIFPQPGWVEHDPREIWNTQLEVVREVLAKSKLSGKDVAALGITNQ